MVFCLYEWLLVQVVVEVDVEVVVRLEGLKLEVGMNTLRRFGRQGSPA